MSSARASWESQSEARLAGLQLLGAPDLGARPDALLGDLHKIEVQVVSRGEGPDRHAWEAPSVGQMHRHRLPRWNADIVTGFGGAIGHIDKRRDIAIGGKEHAAGRVIVVVVAPDDADH